jgi:hypothetical protein
VDHIAKGAKGFHLGASQFQLVSALREPDAIIIRAEPLNWQSSTTDWRVGQFLLQCQTAGAGGMVGVG